RVRGRALAAEPPLDSPGRVLALLNIFSSRRYRLNTPLGLEECVARLRRRSASRWSPLTWFARSAERPLLGRVSQKGFALKVRHVLTRPTMLDEARGRFSADATGRTDRPRLYDVIRTELEANEVGSLAPSH